MINKTLFLALATTVLWSSCKKEETKVLLNPGGANTLTSTISTIVLVQANGANTAGSFTWSKADFGFKAATSYTLQLCKGGTNFATASTTEINLGSSLTKSFTVTEFNGKMLDIIPYGSAQAVQARVKAVVSSSVDPVYTNVVSMTVTAYRDLINYTFPQALWIAGNYQGWSPGSAPKIVDKFASGTTGSNYEGYINFTDPSPQFKMVKGNDWSAGDYGNCGGANSLSSPCGTNFSLGSGAGIYLLRANTNALTWSATKITTWGIIGSATPGGWGSSTPMTFNAGSGTWTITTDLTGGQELKFRANDDWAINFGDNSPADNKPEYNGSNIAINQGGNYTITLDLSVGGNYAYTIKKN